MQVYYSQNTLKKVLEELKTQGKTIGFVPTMGALHAGHLSLLEHAQQNCDITVTSIFVNPTQFNNPSDFTNYPRTKEQDLALLKGKGCDIVFYPQNKDEVFPTDFKDVNLNYGILESVMEGKHRPGHFKGVANVVSCLFNIVNPTTAFFGLKDFQQFAVINALVKQLNYPIKLVGVETKRADNGLALSSRNALLSPENLDAAQQLYKAMSIAKDALTQSVAKAYTSAEQHLKSIPNFTLEYFCIAESRSLKPIDITTPIEKLVQPRAFVAGFLGKVRLIDNLSLID